MARAKSCPPLLGEVLSDRYLVRDLVGRGGMGLVYRADDLVGQRPVVLKMLAPRWRSDPEAGARFRREGRRLAQLDHPNVVAFLGTGSDAGLDFIVMEHIRGESLSHLLERRRCLCLAELAPIADQVLAAVGYAHGRGMMLRDIKPSNIMLCEREGRASFVKMLDFGLAKLVTGDEYDVTRSCVLGTCGYLAPEVIKAQPFDERVDVYALGILLFLMLTGISPIRGEHDGALLYQHVHGEPLALPAHLPPGAEVPRGLVELVHQCLEKHPDDRPSDARAMLEVFRRAVPETLRALPAPTAESRRGIAAFQRRLVLPDEAGSSAYTRAVGDRPPLARPATARLPLSGETETQRPPRGRAEPPPTQQRIDATHVTPAPASAPLGTAAPRPLPLPPDRVEVLGLLALGLSTALGLLAVTTFTAPPVELAPRACGFTNPIASAPEPEEDELIVLEHAPTVRVPVTVTGPEGARISIDGQPVGVTEFRGTLPPGPHPVTIEAEGHRPYQWVLPVEAGIEVELAPLLDPIEPPTLARDREGRRTRR